MLNTRLASYSVLYVRKSPTSKVRKRESDQESVR